MLEKSDEVRRRAHDAYFKESLEDNRYAIWSVLDSCADNWKQSGGKSTLEEYVRENGNPSHKIVSRRTFELCEYNDTWWAMHLLSKEDLAVWAKEQGLCGKTLLALRESE